MNAAPPFGSPSPPLLDRPAVRWAAAGAVVLLLGAAVGSMRFGSDLSHVSVAVLSGEPEGNYHAVVRQLAERAESRGATLHNVASTGSEDNLARLQQAAQDCNGGELGVAPGFALVQESFNFAEYPHLHLVARLPVSETVFFLGKSAGAMSHFAHLSGKRLGIGPPGSGTSRLAAELLARLPGIRVQVFDPPLAQQVELLARGALDVGVFVMWEEAALIHHAVVERGLQVAAFREVPGLAHRLPLARAATLAAGQLEPVKVLPPEDTPVLQIDTLLVANRCPARSHIMGVMALLQAQYPHLVEHNRRWPTPGELPYHAHAQAYLDNHGPELLDEYAPWLADNIPLGNLVLLIMAVSILFNLMGAGHRFRLWRIDAGRVRLEGILPDIFGPEVVIQEIATLQPTASHRQPEKKQRLEALIQQLDELKSRVRRHSLSVLVPMGQEMAYRYQESLIAERIAALRDFRRRLG